MADVTFSISGSACRVIHDGSWPQDHPEWYEHVRTGQRRRRGRGSTVTITMPREAALALAHYLNSVDEVISCMTPEERDGDRDHVIARRAVDRIEQALEDSYAR